MERSARRPIFAQSCKFAELADSSHRQKYRLLQPLEDFKE
jgi:hypothetical protein